MPRPRPERRPPRAIDWIRDRDLRTGLTAELTKWFDPKGCETSATKCFVYDDGIKSIIGLEASFGSDEENDHHFHYGYFLYAAALVAKDDKALRMAADLLHGIKVNASAPTTADKTATDKPANKAAN